jgi:hypothetical protein
LSDNARVGRESVEVSGNVAEAGEPRRSRVRAPSAGQQDEAAFGHGVTTCTRMLLLCPASAAARLVLRCLMGASSILLPVTRHPSAAYCRIRTRTGQSLGSHIPLASRVPGRPVPLPIPKQSAQPKDTRLLGTVMVLAGWYQVLAVGPGSLSMSLPDSEPTGMPRSASRFADCQQCQLLLHRCSPWQVLSGYASKA